MTHEIPHLHLDIEHNFGQWTDSVSIAVTG